jgi:hypothetical protein
MKTKKKLLITFGCSWVFGVGVGYSKGMSEKDYEKIARDPKICDVYSFRGLLSEKLRFDNINFSMGGSGNQCQFRLAKEFFVSRKFKNLKNEYDEIIVLWGITSTARNELFNIQTQEYKNFFYNPPYPYKDWPFPKDFLLYSYDHDAAVREIAIEINMFNLLFEYHNIKCIWFDTFNHHDYLKDTEKAYNVHKGKDWPLFNNGACLNDDNIPNEIQQEINEKISTEIYIKNFLFFTRSPRDLLSMMLSIDQPNLTLGYHTSTWACDNDNIKIATEKKLLNNYTFHPTKLGHQEIAKILEPEILKIMEN